MLIAAVDTVARETMLFAAIWFLLGGLDDLAVDLVYLARRVCGIGTRILPLDALPPPRDPGRFAIFVAAWDESAVIGRMLRTALARFDHEDYRIYVGTYPNDRPTIDAVAAVAEEDPRVRLVVGSAPGPTTKADCLNHIWRALLRDEAAEGRRVTAIVLHDAEDIVHRGEMRVFERHLATHAAVQLPVLPLRHPSSRLISGHYCDEFAEAHAKQLLVREALGAALPLAGVGCAISRAMVQRIADLRGGAPFDASSLTEDYELGLTISELGGRTALARVPERPGGLPVAVRAYFPGTLAAAVRQKARWMTGIALAGWDRVGWSANGKWSEHWMRMRDRRATLAMPVLAIAYCALVAWGTSLALHPLAGLRAPTLAPPMRWLLLGNFALLLWRVGVRFRFVERAYGWREGLWSLPRMLVANYIGLLAARRAAFLYLDLLRSGIPKWDKTQHQFPDEAETLPA